MPHDSFLHQRDDFKALVETVAEGEKINDPALVEKRLTRSKPGQVTVSEARCRPSGLVREKSHI